MFSNNLNQITNVTNETISLQDFKILNVLGQGYAGKVFLVEKVGGCDNGTNYAMKSIKKTKRRANGKLLLERNILVKSDHPFIVKLFYAFQTRDKVYLVMEFHQAGDFYNQIISADEIPEDDARLYLAEIILALDHIHSLGVLYRDLKPENILVGKDGHLVLTDFGLCGWSGISKDNCGTLDYISPEVLKQEQAQTIAVDWWSLGVFMHVLLTGFSLFDGSDDKSTWHNIQYREPVIAKRVSPDAKCLILGLLHKDPQRRLGSGGVEEIKNHPFFKSVDWGRIAAKMDPVPFVPTFNGPSDLGHFESELTSLLPNESRSSSLEDVNRVMLNDFQYIHPKVEKQIPSPPVMFQNEGFSLLKVLNKSCNLASPLGAYRTNNYNVPSQHHNLCEIRPMKRTLDSIIHRNKENETPLIDFEGFEKPYHYLSYMESNVGKLFLQNKKPKK